MPVIRTAGRTGRAGRADTAECATRAGRWEKPENISSGYWLSMKYWWSYGRNVNIQLTVLEPCYTRGENFIAFILYLMPVWIFIVYYLARLDFDGNKRLVFIFIRKFLQRKNVYPMKISFKASLFQFFMFTITLI